MTIVARFEIHYSRFLDAEGKAVGALPAFARDPGELVAMYRGMVLTRRFDAKAVALQRTGRLGTFAVSLGQEAAVIGPAAAVREGRLTADELLQHYCTLVYAKLGSYEQAARRLQIDRRTVRSKINEELLARLKAAPR